MTTVKYYFFVAVTILVGLSLSIGVAGSTERLPMTAPLIKGWQKQVVPKPQATSTPSSVPLGTAPSTYPPPKAILVSTTLSSVGPKIDTSNMPFDPPKSINIQNSLSAIGPRIDISGMPFDPPKNITVTATITGVGPR